MNFWFVDQIPSWANVCPSWACSPCGVIPGPMAASWANVCPSWACSPCWVIPRPTAGATLFLEKGCIFALHGWSIGSKGLTKSIATS